jgi:hypothetical protein
MRVRGSGAFAAALGVTLLLLLVGVPLAFALGGLYEASLEGWQFVEVEVEVVDESGAPAGPARVAAFELADGGPKLLAEGRASLSGVYKFGAKVPRRLVAELEDGARVYAPLNLWIVAWREDDLLATLTQPIDIAALKHPLDTLKLRLQARRIAQTATKESAATASWCPLPTEGAESWAWTSVLQVGTWDSISAKWYYPMGTRIMVESKERVWLVNECRYGVDWYNAGSTIVALEHGVGSADWVGGRNVYTSKFYLKYYMVRYYPPGSTSLQIEKAYAVDTSSDPRGAMHETASWSGQLPGWSYYSLIGQGCQHEFPVTAAFNVLTVTVSFSLSTGGVSIGLGVGRASTPVGTLSIRAGTWQPGYMVKVESSDGSYVVTRCNWVRP